MLTGVMLNVLLTPEYTQHMVAVALQQDHAQSYKTDIIWSLYAYPQETSTQVHPACLKHYHKKRNDARIQRAPLLGTISFICMFGLSPPVKYFTDRSRAVLLLWIFYVFVLSCVCYVLCASVYMCFVVTCWERADLLALVCGVFCEFVTFPLVSWVRCGT